MSLLSLPEEVFIIIVKKLDLNSLNSLYNTCQFVRNKFQICNIVKEWHMSAGPLANVKFLKSDFFKDVAGQLTVMNLCGVTDLYKTALLPAIRRSKRLITLDVSYTGIALDDLIDLYKVCPSIKNLTINFEFYKGEFNIAVLLEKYHEIFKDMVNIHFVGTHSYLLNSNIMQNFLEKANLNILKLTVLYSLITLPLINLNETTSLVKFNELHVYLMNSEASFGKYYTSSLFRGITKDCFEILIINTGENSDFYETNYVNATPIFKDFFKEMFNLKIKDIEEFDNYLEGNMLFMIFNKESVKFDTKFFNRLFNILKDFFPRFFNQVHQSPCQDRFDWFYTHPIMTETKPKTNSNSLEFKKKRTGTLSFTLDYDFTFQHKRRLKLSFLFSTSYTSPVALSPNTDFLSKLTYLNLSGMVQYSIEFFNVLFRCCTCLETLNVEAPSISPCFRPISRTIPLSQTLRNFRLVDRNIDLPTFLNSLSQCKSLENIIIHDQSSESISLADPNALFENCRNLYNISIKATMTDNLYSKMRSLFKNAQKARGKPQIKVLLTLNHKFNTVAFNYHHTLSEFKVFRIQPDHCFTYN